MEELKEVKQVGVVEEEMDSKEKQREEVESGEREAFTSTLRYSTQTLSRT